MLELNRSYEARFLGREVLTTAVTSELLSHLVHELPEVAHGGSVCTVLCSASGLIVTRAVSGHGKSVLRVPLANILFCHVDKARPEVTVWVVRTRDGDGVPVGHTPGLAGTTTISAYVYKCLNPSDAVGLFQSFNEMNRQAKLDKYRRNVEKKEEAPHFLTARGDISQQSSKEGSKDSDSDESHNGSSSSGVSSGSNTSLAPSVTIISSGLKPERRFVPSNHKVGVRPWLRGNQTLNRNIVNAINHQDNMGNFIQNGSSPTWTSIAGSIESYRQSFSALRPRDKEMRMAVLEELRQKLQSRSVTSSGSEPREVIANRATNPLLDATNLASQGSRQLANNRQRMPVKTINEPLLSDKQQQLPVLPSSAAISNRTSRNFQFPFSMGNMMKKLVTKNRGTSPKQMQPIQAPLWMPVKGPLTLPAAMPIANHSPTRKFKSKKGPAPPPPKPPTIISRMVSHGIDPYFYLPPISSNQKDGGGGVTNGRTDVFVPVLPPAWVHHRAKESAIPEAARKAHSGSKVHSGSAVSTSTINGINDSKKGLGGHKKKVIASHGLGRFARGQKKRTPSFVGNFNRSASTTSRGSSSSESGAEGKLRSVMKKPKQREDNSPPEQKKNVTFHAYATVQVLP